MKKKNDESQIISKASFNGTSTNNDSNIKVKSNSNNVNQNKVQSQQHSSFGFAGGPSHG